MYCFVFISRSLPRLPGSRNVACRTSSSVSLSKFDIRTIGVRHTQHSHITYAHMKQKFHLFIIVGDMIYAHKKQAQCT